MPVLAIIVTYLVIGALFGRYFFTVTLGTADRLMSPDNPNSRWTVQYCNAFWGAILCLPLWPLLGVLRMVMAPTPHERNQAKLAQQKEMAVRQKQLEKDILQFGSKIKEI